MEKYEGENLLQHLSFGEVEIVTTKETKVLFHLKKVLTLFGIPTIYYSIKGYSEDAVCIECQGFSWIVYNGEKGNKYNLKCYNNVVSASYDLISRVSESEEESRKMKNVFRKKIQDEVRKNRLYTAAISPSMTKRKYKRKIGGQRRNLLEYLKRTDKGKYRSLVEKMRE